MRDPQRVSAVLEYPVRIWCLHPGWRLGQLVCNLAAWADPTQNISWDIGDDVLLAQIRQHLSQQREPVEVD